MSCFRRHHHSCGAWQKGGYAPTALRVALGYRGAGITNCVWITNAATRPSLRVILVCHTMVVRPRCRGVQVAFAVSPLGIAAKKLVLLSIVVVVAPAAKLATVAMAPNVSASAMTAPPCRTAGRVQ